MKPNEATINQLQIILMILDDIPVKGNENLSKMLNAMNRIKSVEQYIREQWKDHEPAAEGQNPVEAD